MYKKHLQKIIKCPFCKSPDIIKKGRRKTRLGSRQLYYCKDCKKGFADSKLVHKTYGLKVVVSAVTYLKVSSQLYLYAMGLSFRTSIPLKNFICAWFDEKIYYEFSPVEARINF